MILRFTSHTKKTCTLKRPVFAGFDVILKVNARILYLYLIDYFSSEGFKWTSFGGTFWMPNCFSTSSLCNKEANSNVLL